MSAQAIPWEGRKGAFRTCTATGLKVDLSAEALIKANAVAAVVSLVVGGVMALLIALTRWQAIHLLPADLFYRFLTVHGFDMLVSWIVFFEIAGLYFGSTVLLNARMVMPSLGWLGFLLMVVGALLLNIVVFAGLGGRTGVEGSDVLFTAYVPLQAHPLFYLGYILFAVGALIGVALFFANLVVARVEGRHRGSLPLVTFGLATAGIIATYTILSGAVAMVPAFFWSLGLMKSLDPGFFRNVFWSFGHAAQQINLAAMVAVWYALAGLTVGARVVNEKVSRFAFILYILFIDLGSAHHLLTDPGLSFAWKVTNTSYAMHLAVLGSLIHAFTIPAAVEVAQRARGYVRGLFEWLQKAPWREPGFSSLVVSMFIFGWIGGITGVVIGTEQLNMLAHNTLRVPGHFHAVVVGGTSLAFMGLTYYLIPLIFRRELRWPRLASLQPYLFGLGILLLSVGFIAAGLLGVPRRHWDITFVNAPFQAALPGAAQIFLAIAGIGAILAVLGGIVFVAVVLASVLTGRRVEPKSVTLVVHQPPPVPAGASPDADDRWEERHQPKGAFTLVLIFLTFFAAYYIANWWLLGRAWFVR